jgi:hypothetical protein
MTAGCWEFALGAALVGAAGEDGAVTAIAGGVFCCEISCERIWLNPFVF